MAAMALAFNEFGCPFIILREQEKKTCLLSLDVHIAAGKAITRILRNLPWLCQPSQSSVDAHKSAAFGWIGGVGLELIAITIGGRIVLRFQQLSPEKLGNVGLIRDFKN
ncbi:hypothetical protein U9M48_005568 [Paspalum notatum var. saurae]|uniref:Uncharacterized protein n=1 Tax=Paspalum notatum var. saurae TaxID=547442 RepID=A0AAQ3PVY2_PASNO